MPGRCEKCGRRAETTMAVARRKALTLFSRCRCGGQISEVQEGAAPTVEVRRSRGQLSVKLRGPSLFVLEPEPLEQAFSAVFEELDTTPANVLANLEEVAYLARAGLGVLARLQSTVQAGGHQLAVVNASSSFKALLERDAPELAGALTDSERKAAALLARTD